MILTNKFDIPDTFVNVLKRPTYSKGKANLSVTQLINSPKIVALTKKHDNEIEQDVSDMIWSIFGSAIHNVLEHGKDDHHRVEERIHASIEGWNISGAVDLQIINPNGISIRDYKTTSVWAVMNEKIEWEYQLNIYAWLVEEVKKVPVTDLGIVAILRDWKAREVNTKVGYPEAPVKELPITLWTMQEREDFIKRRIWVHSACDFEIETDGQLPDCTPDEMWEKPAVWAVMKEGNIRAKYVMPTLHEAELAMKQLQEEKPKDKYVIVERKGERTRCASYCAVSQWCDQYQEYLKTQEENKE
jgi:hypothetical protein